MALKVYYLDDETELLELVQDILSGPELEICTFATVESLLEAVKEAEPDLFVLDYRIPGTTGVEVAQLLPACIPKVLMTGELEVPENNHFVACFAKPFAVEELQSYISELMLRTDLSKGD